MNFLAENHREAAANISFTDCPGHLMKDLLVAFGRNNKNDGNVASVDELSVSALRRKLNSMGLKDIDGSREVMIDSIKRRMVAPPPTAGGLFGAHSDTNLMH